MARKKHSGRTVDICSRIEQAERDKNPALVSDILDHATAEEARALEPVLGGLLQHTQWLVRASAVELVGRFQLTQFLNVVRACVKDKNAVVRQYAMMGYYDLLGSKALGLIRKWCEASNAGDRVTALTLCYSETGEPHVLEKLSKILTRKRCHWRHRHVALNAFDYYLDVGRHPEVVRLFEDILRSVRSVPGGYGLDKVVPRKLREWTQSGRKRKKEQKIRGHL